MSEENKYLEKCPECQSNDISYEEWESEDTICSCKMYCQECDFVGIQYYKVNGWERYEE
jgi:hypothetical protein